jgi:hypothetical protein
MLFLLLGACVAPHVAAHEHEPITHTFKMKSDAVGPRFSLNIVDAETGQPIAARFSIEVDGQTHVPDWVSEGAVRFTSSHTKKKQDFTATYARGAGPIEVSLPPNAKNVRVIATKGFEYLPAQGRLAAGGGTLEIPMRKWIDIEAAGWVGIDEHLHYDRLSEADDDEWLAMLDGDGLGLGHFMVLKGAMVDGVWSRQYAHGPEGQAFNGRQLVVPGEEYRDSSQGHINLLGVNEIVQPISTGGLGVPKVAENFPPLHDVFVEAKRRDGIVGVAHAGTLGRHPTAVADAVLGAMDYWELSNGFIYNTDNWYRLMNCGVFLPALAGTDLPNSPLRDPWQPMLGSIRTYVNTGGARDFESFKAAVKAGKTFISGGPIIALRVNGLAEGGAFVLPEGGGPVVVEVEMSSPRQPRELILIRDGQPARASIQKIQSNGVHRWSITASVPFKKSGWISAWGEGAATSTNRFATIAHAGVVRVLVGEERIESSSDARNLIGQMRMRREYYRNNGVYKTEADKKHMLSLFDRAIEKLSGQVE